MILSELLCIAFKLYSSQIESNMCIRYYIINNTE